MRERLRSGDRSGSRRPSDRRGNRDRRSNNNVLDNIEDYDVSDILGEEESDSSSEDLLNSMINNKKGSSYISRLGYASEEALANSDTTEVYSTKYSIHVLLPYLLSMFLLTIGFVYVDYSWDIIYMLSVNSKYKFLVYIPILAAWGFLLYLFIKFIIEFYTFRAYLTKYKFVTVSRNTYYNDMPFYLVQEFRLRVSFFGGLLNYGTLQVFSTGGGKYTYDKIANAKELYNQISKLTDGKKVEKHRGIISDMKNYSMPLAQPDKGFSLAGMLKFNKKS